MRIVRIHSFAQCSVRAKGSRSGLNHDSGRHGRRLPAGRLRQRRYRSWSADSLHRLAGAVDGAGAGSRNLGSAVARYKYLASRGWRRSHRACTPAVADARRNLPRHIRGAVLLPHDATGQATIWLGVALALYAALGLLNVHFKVPQRAETWLGLVMGAATGAITVATGIFVMPGTPYVQALQFERDKLVQALGLSFTVSTVTLALALAYAGQIHPSLAGASLVALLAALVGMLFGQLVRGRVRAETFRLWFFIGLLLLGGHLALRGLL